MHTSHTSDENFVSKQMKSWPPLSSDSFCASLPIFRQYLYLPIFCQYLDNISLSCKIFPAVSTCCWKTMLQKYQSENKIEAFKCLACTIVQLYNCRINILSHQPQFCSNIIAKCCWIKLRMQKQQLPRSHKVHSIYGRVFVALPWQPVCI